MTSYIFLEYSIIGNGRTFLVAHAEHTHGMVCSKEVVQLRHLTDIMGDSNIYSLLWHTNFTMPSVNEESAEHFGLHLNRCHVPGVQKGALITLYCTCISVQTNLKTNKTVSVAWVRGRPENSCLILIFYGTVLLFIKSVLIKVTFYGKSSLTFKVHGVGKKTVKRNTSSSKTCRISKIFIGSMHFGLWP